MFGDKVDITHFDAYFKKTHLIAYG